MLSGANTYSGGTIVNNGGLTLTGGGAINSGGQLIVTGSGGAAPVFNLAGGNFTSSNGGDAIYVGVNSGDTGTVNIGSGSISLTGNSSAAVLLADDGNGTWNQTGGSVTLAGGFWQANQDGSIAQTSISGGILTCNTFLLTQRGAGTLNISGSGSVTANTVALVGWTEPACTGTVNLLTGGTLTAGAISQNFPGQGAAGTGTFNFNGGLLIASGNNASFMAGLTAATVEDAGGIIDNGGYAITIGQALAHGGVSATDGGLVLQGSGTTTLSGANSYNGTTSINAGTVAYGADNTLPATSAITINGGTLNIATYSGSTGPVTLVGGAITGTSGVLSGASYNVQNGTISAALGGSSSALVKTTAGLAILSGANTYGGGTTISAGTLQVGNGGNNGTLGMGGVTNNATLVFSRSDTGLNLSQVISGSGNLYQNGSGTTVLSGSNTYTGLTTVNAGGLVVNGSLVSSTVNINAGTLLVNGMLPSSGAVNVSSGAALGGSGSAGNALVAPGGIIDVTQNGANTTLNLASLTFNGNAAINLGSLTNYSSALAINGGTVTANGDPGSVVFNLPNMLVANGTYRLLGYSGDSIGGLGDLAFALGSHAGFGVRQTPSLQDTGSELDLVVTGDYPIWSGANGTAWKGQNNWVLAIAGTATDFRTGDTVVFNDNAVGTSVTISGGNVFPASVTFNNNSLSYTISGSNGIIGSGPLVMNGSGTVTIASSNSYSGGTQLNAGLLNVNRATALGTGTLTIAGGTLGNTSGAAVTLTANNPQSWNTDVVFNGPNDLNLGTGPVTMAASRTVTVTSGNLTVGGAIGGTGMSLTKAGPGNLTLAGANTYNAGTFVFSGTLTAAADAALSNGPVTLNPSSGTAVLAFTSAAPRSACFPAAAPACRASCWATRLPARPPT